MSSLLQRDLESVAAERRRDLGEPPTPEQLIALRDGLLGESDAERVREYLAVDQDLAEIYLGLCRAEAADPDELSEEELGRRFRELEHSTASRRFPPLGLAAAAAVLLVGGLLVVGQWMPRVGPGSDYVRVVVDADALRGEELPRIDLPASKRGVELEIPVDALTPHGLRAGEPLRLSLVAADGRRVHELEVPAASADAPAVVRLDRELFENGGSFELLARHGPADPSVQLWAFTIRPEP